MLPLTGLSQFMDHILQICRVYGARYPFTPSEMDYARRKIFDASTDKSAERR
jgi:hypothetical protein